MVTGTTATTLPAAADPPRAAPCPASIVQTLSKKDPTSLDLTPLAGSIGDRRLVGVGETEHGGKQFHQLTYRLAETLAVDRPVVMALEIDQAHARRLDRFVRGLADEDLEQLWRDRWWASQPFYDDALGAFLLRARALNRQQPDRIRVAGYDLKQPDLALTEIWRDVANTNPGVAEPLRDLAKEVLALGSFGVVANVAGFTADLAITLPKPEADDASHLAMSSSVRVVVPVRAQGVSYGQAGINLHHQGAAWNQGVVATLDANELAGASRELAVELVLEPGNGPLELTVWHRGNGTVHFGAPQLTPHTGTTSTLDWAARRLRPLMLPNLQADDYRVSPAVDSGDGHDVGDLVVTATPTFDSAHQAAEKLKGWVNQYLAAAGEQVSAEQHKWLPQLATLVHQAVAWRTLRERNRDVFLAANVAWLTTAFPQHQIVVAGHTSHTNRLPGRSMGFWLAERFPDYLAIALLAQGGNQRYWSGPEMRTGQPSDAVPIYPIQSSPWAVALAPLARSGLPALFDTRIDTHGKHCLPVPHELWGPPGDDDGRRGRRETAALMLLIEHLDAAELITSVPPRLVSSRTLEIPASPLVALPGRAGGNNRR